MVITSSLSSLLLLLSGCTVSCSWLSLSSNCHSFLISDPGYSKPRKLKTTTARTAKATTAPAAPTAMRPLLLLYSQPPFMPIFMLIVLLELRSKGPRSSSCYFLALLLLWSSVASKVQYIQYIITVSYTHLTLPTILLV